MTRKRALLLAAVIGAFSVPVAACSLLVSTSGLTTAEASGDAGEAGLDVTPISMDGAPLADGGDAARDAGGCDAGFCACLGDAHSFCDDFDSVPTGADWMINQFGAGTVAYDRDDTFSPPINLLATSQALTSGNLHEVIDTTAPHAVTRLRVEVDMAIVLSDPVYPMNGTHGVCPINVNLQPGDQTIRLNVYGGDADLEQLSGGNPVNDQRVTVPTTTGARARYGVWLDTKTRTCGVTVDGVERLPSCVLDPAITGGTPSLELGISFVRTPTSEWKIRFDNVTADYD